MHELFFAGSKTTCSASYNFYELAVPASESTTCFNQALLLSEVAFEAVDLSAS